MDNATRLTGTTPGQTGERGSTATPAARIRATVALEGGPKDRYWYWLTDWQTQRESARAQHVRLDQPVPAILCYQPTGQYIENPNPVYGRGEVWRYTPPQPSADDVPTPRRADGAVSCPTCGHPAPRLITWPAAHRPEPLTECLRCAYPAQRYLGTWTETMPAADAAWYSAHPTRKEPSP